MNFDRFYSPIQYFNHQYSQGVSSSNPHSRITSSRPPAGPPPPFTPSKKQEMYQPFSSGFNAYMVVDPSVIKTYLFRYVYIWLKNGTGFWAWLNYVDNAFTAGWQWAGTNWVPFRLEIRRIDSIAGF